MELLGAELTFAETNTPVRMAYVVPTKDRPDDMRTLLASLQRQTRGVEQIIVVDGSDPAIDEVLAEFSDLAITYVRVFPPSLAKQRNAGMAVLDDGINIAGYLDDDLVLEPDATERMIEFWQSADSNIGGAAFSILNQPKAMANWLTGLFLLDDPSPGKMLASGFQAQIPTLFETIPTDWLYGGATLWRRSVIEAFQYDEWYIGHGYLEDVDFSYRVRQHYQLCVVGKAQVNHYSRPIRLESNYGIGKQQILNRLYFIRKVGGFSALRTAQAFAGQMLFNIASSLRQFDSAGWRRFLGNVVGLLAALKGQTNQVGGHYK